MKVSARRLDQEKGLLASGHEGRACLQELKKFMGARKPELQQQGKEESETRIPTLSICTYHTVFQITSGSTILYVPELLWLKKGAFIPAVKTNNTFLFLLFQVQNFLPKKCLLQPEVRDMEVMPRIGGTQKFYQSPAGLNL